MVPLGWTVGVVGLLAATAISLYANSLAAKLHEFGGKRHSRYRDLAGKESKFNFLALQYVNLFMINVGYIILAGSALNVFLEGIFATYVLFRDDHVMKLPLAGFVCVLFATSIPHLSALRLWLGISTILSLIYIIVAIALSAKDGINSPARDYSIYGTSSGKIFTSIGAAANLVFAFNTGMLPEIQPSLILTTVTSFNLTYAVTFIGNTKFGNKGSALAIRNLSFRVGVRGGYIFITTLVSALLPFLGDFMILTGAISTFPRTFILANHMYLVAKKNKLSSLQKLWHWLNVCFFGCMSLAAAVSAFRLIAVDSKNYNLFADLWCRFGAFQEIPFPAFDS